MDGSRKMKNLFNYGGCIVSKNILDNKGKLKWCFREEPVNELDNGWRFLSDIDTDEFLEEVENMNVCSWETIFYIEPAVMKISNLPIGTELILEYDSKRKYFVDSNTGKEIM